MAMTRRPRRWSHRWVLPLVLQQLSLAAAGNATDGLCQPIAIPFCAGLPYRETVMPNLLGHAGQTVAGYEVHRYAMLWTTRCSHDLKTFLCAVFAPACTANGEPAPPCRSLCTSARNGCQSSMAEHFGQQWPADLECSKFPDGGPTCYSGGHVWPGSDDGNRERAGGGGGAGTGFEVCGREPGTETDADGRGDCGVPCDAFWSPEQTRTARSWVAAWSALCAASCLFACCTFAVDTRRFPYPERPVVYLSLCHLIVAAAHLVGCLAGDGVACTGHGLIARGARHDPRCAALFVATYFFGTASAVWWIVLSLTWFLAAGLKWGHEAIGANSRYFHLAAWTVPAVQTAAALGLGEIEGDVLSGVCSVAVWSDDTAARDMVLIPSVVYLVLGAAVWTADVVSLFRVRDVMRRRDGPRAADGLRKCMVRIGVFNVLHVVPAVARVLCLVYEHVNRGSWTAGPHSAACPRSGPGHAAARPSPETDGPATAYVHPSLEVFIAKHVASLQVGVASTVWMCSGKTLSGWHRLLSSAARVPRPVGSETRV